MKLVDTFMKKAKPLLERAELVAAPFAAAVLVPVAYSVNAAGYYRQGIPVGILAAASVIVPLLAARSILKEADQAEKRKQAWEAEKERSAAPAGPR